jgi:hypothetical protein
MSQPLDSGISLFSLAAGIFPGSFFGGPVNLS